MEFHVRKRVAFALLLAVLCAVVTAFYARNYLFLPGPDALTALSKPARKELRTYTDAEAYAVYSVVIPKVLFMGSQSAVIIQETETFDFSKTPRDACLPVNAKRRNRYEAIFRENDGAAAKNWLLSRALIFNNSLTLVPKQQIDSIFKQRGSKGWKEFDERFPGNTGVIAVSAVAFNATKSQAYLYVSFNCGATCGSGGFHLLEKKQGKWTEIGLGCGGWNA